MKRHEPAHNDLTLKSHPLPPGNRQQAMTSQNCLSVLRAPWVL